MTNLTTIEQLDNNNPSLSSASANWGQVYQKYISINLSSDQLMKGAYDAYNLLTAGKLSSFQGKAITAINTLISNQKSLASDLNKTVTNLNKFFYSLKDKEDVSIAEGDTISSKFTLSFPADESGAASARTTYDLSKDVTIPLVNQGTPGLLKFSDFTKFTKVTSLFNTENASASSLCTLSFPASDDDTQNSTKYNLSTSATIPLASGTTPGLIRGADFTKFTKVANLFDTVSTSASSNYTLSFPSNDNGTTTSYDLSDSVSINFVTASNPGLLKGSDYNKFSKVSDKFTSSVSSWKANSANDLASDASSMDVIVYKINRLQQQVNTLTGVINGLFSGDANYVLTELHVGSIVFATPTTKPPVVPDDSGFIKPDIVKLS